MWLPSKHGWNPDVISVVKSENSTTARTELQNCWCFHVGQRSGHMSSHKVRKVESIIAKKQLIWLVHGFETTTQWILRVLVLVLLDLLRCAFLKLFVFCCVTMLYCWFSKLNKAEFVAAAIAKILILSSSCHFLLKTAVLTFRLKFYFKGFYHYLFILFSFFFFKRKGCTEVGVISRLLTGGMDG